MIRSHVPQPNFFILGAPKCGTTSLADWLAQHPQVWFSPEKEPFYWNTDHVTLQRKTADEYAALFAGAGPQHKAVGEGTVYYLVSHAAVPNIERELPGSRYIVCLRNPVDMAHSLYLEERYNGNETLPSFEAAWDAQERRRERPDTLPGVDPVNLQYHRFCEMGEQVERLCGTVDRERVLVLFLSELAADAPGTFSRVCRFLGIDDMPVDFRVVNTAKERALPWLHTLQKRIGNWRNRHGLGRSLGLGRHLTALNRRPGRKPEMDPALRPRLTEAFADDIRRLARVTGRDLGEWLAPIDRAS